METIELHDRVTVAVDGHLATVTLTREERHNALDGPMFRAIAEAGARVEEFDEVRAVVLHGAGRSFCSGLDLGALGEGENALSMDELVARDVPGRDTTLAQEVALVWRRLPVPVIAAVHGNCLGGGLQIALGADVRIVAPDAKLSIREGQWGLIPDMGITQTLPGLVRPDVARELTWTARVVSGTEAVALGLATREDSDPLAAARELAGTIAERSPAAVRSAKRLYAEAPALAAADALALETELQVELIDALKQAAAGG